MTQNSCFSRLTWLCACLVGCSSGAESPQNTEILTCITQWIGEIEHYERPNLTLRACLKAGLCSDELEMVLPKGVGDRYSNFDFRAVLYQNESTEPSELEVQLYYRPEVAADLTDADRPSLIVRDDAGETLIDSVSQVPFETVYVERAEISGDPNEQGTEMCRVISLNLDGTNRGFVLPEE